MSTLELRRSLAIAAFTIVGGGGAFALGVRVGAALDRSTRSVSVAKVPVSQWEHASPSPEERPAIARK